VLVVTGPSGVGKGSLTKALISRLPGLALAVSATTRGARPGEIEGRDYYFVTEQEFQRLEDAGELLESATYANHRYGTLRSELERPVDGLVLEIELQGARQLRRSLPDAPQVFIAPPSLDTLKARLLERGVNSPLEIEQRLTTAACELEAREEFTHVVVNDRFEDAVSEFVELVATIWKLKPRRTFT
jgi:guanylate kinase